MERLKVNLCGIELDNPIIPASGTFGYGLEMNELYDINMLGTFSKKDLCFCIPVHKQKAEQHKSRYNTNIQNKNY